MSPHPTETATVDSVKPSTVQGSSALPEKYEDFLAAGREVAEYSKFTWTPCTGIDELPGLNFAAADQIKVDASKTDKQMWAEATQLLQAVPSTVGDGAWPKLFGKTSLIVDVATAFTDHYSDSTKTMPSHLGKSMTADAVNSVSEALEALRVEYSTLKSGYDRIPVETMKTYAILVNFLQAKRDVSNQMDFFLFDEDGQPEKLGSDDIFVIVSDEAEVSKVPSTPLPQHDK